MYIYESFERCASPAADSGSFRLSIAERCRRPFKSGVDNCALYYAAFAVYFISLALLRTALADAFEAQVDFVDTILKATAAFLLAFKFIAQGNSAWEWIISIFLSGAGLLSWKCSGAAWLFWATMFVVCAKGVDLKTLAKSVLILTIATLLVVFAFTWLGFIENLAYTRGAEVRYCLGFSHPNTLGLYLLLMCFSFSVFRFGKNPIPDLVLIAITGAFNLMVANSRTCVVLSLVQAVLLVVFYWARNRNGRKILGSFFVVIVVLTVVISLYFMVAYDPSSSFHLALNSALSGRFWLASSYYKMQPLTTFGSSFKQFDTIYWDWGKPVVFLVDNAWCHLILHFGVIPFLIFICGYLGTICKALHEKRWDATLFGLVLMAIYGFCETYGIRIECNFLLCAMGTELLYSSGARDCARRFVERLRRKK